MNRKLIFCVIAISILLVILLSGCQKKDSCLKFNSPEQKDECYLELGKTNNNISFCNKITNRYIVHECITDIAISIYDTQLCFTNISNPFFCMEEIATITNNLKICQNIQDDFWKDLCFKKLAENFNQPSLCYNTTNDDSQDDCFYNTAYNFSNAKLCSKLSITNICTDKKCYFGSQLRDRCYLRLSEKINDLGLCELIDDIIANSRCIREFAINNNNLDLCNTIVFEPIRDSCINKLENKTIT